MKRIINAIKWAWTVYRQPQVFQPSMLKILEGQYKFLEEVKNQNRPMVTNIATVVIDDKGKEHEIKILSLWCGVGDGSPIDRCRELAEENNRLKLRIFELAQQPKKD